MNNEILCDYKSVKCISNMEEKYQESFETIVNEYAPRLQNRIHIGNSIFTLHNFNEHCFNLYKMISDVLLDEKLVYSGAYALTQKEMYILNLAVLFHDIGMSECLVVKRENHSVKSTQFIDKEWENKETVFSKNAMLTNNEIESLKLIIKAHSNVKDLLVASEKNGLLDPELDKDIKDKNGKIIRTRFLAGVLRVADELDITSERLGNSNLEEQIEYYAKQLEYHNGDGSISQEECSKIQEMLISLEHWKKLHYISYVERKNEEIIIIVDDNAVKNANREGNSWDSLANILYEIYNEVNNKFSEANSLCFSKSEMKICIKPKKIVLQTEISELKSIINKRISRKSFLKTKDIFNNSDTRDDGEKEDTSDGVNIPAVLNETLEGELSKEIEKRELLTFGHYRLTENYCARDWINTKEIVETRSINQKMVQIMAEHMRKYFDDYIIVGVGFVGTVLASRIAFSLHKSFSYIIPEKDEKNNSNQELEACVPDNKKIVLIIDVIVTYESLMKIIKKYSYSNRIEAIYSVFYRKSEAVKSNEYIQKTYCLNRKFDIEIFSKSECKYKNRCIATNQTINTMHEVCDAKDEQ